MRIRILVYNTSAGEGRHHDFVQRLEGGRDGAIRVEIVCPGDAAAKGEDCVVHGEVCSAVPVLSLMAVHDTQHGSILQLARSTARFAARRFLVKRLQQVAPVFPGSTRSHRTRQGRAE
jgi:hypothetical protein